MVLKEHALGRLTSPAAQRLRIRQAFESTHKGPLKTFYVSEHHIAMQGGFGSKRGTNSIGKYPISHFPSGTFEFDKGANLPLDTVLAEFGIRNESTTHTTDERIAWMWHRLRALDKKFWRGRAGNTRRNAAHTARKKQKATMEETRPGKRRAALGGSGGTWTPMPSHDKAVPRSDSSSSDEYSDSPASEPEEVMQGVVVTSSTTATGAAHHNPLSYIGSVLVVQGASIEVKWGGDWYDATICEVGPDDIKVHYTEGESEEDEWINVNSGRLQSPQARAVQNPRNSDRVRAAAEADAPLPAGTYGKYAQLPGSDDSD